MTIKISYMGGKQTGIIGLLSLLADKHTVLSVASYCDDMTSISTLFNIPTFNTIKDKEYKKHVSESDLLVCVHGREKVPTEYINMTKYGAINVHPYLYKYKGIDPVNKAIKDNCFHASVGCHYMTEEYDKGEVILEKFMDVTPTTSAIEIYNELYPLYSLVLLESLDIIGSLH